MSSRFTRLRVPAALTGALLIGIFAALVIGFRAKLLEEIRRTIIGRDAAVLWPVALRQLAKSEADATAPDTLLAAVLESAKQENMLAVAVFDAQGHLLNFAPSSLLFAELPLDDYLRLLKSETISRYDPEFPVSRYFSGASAQLQQSTTPVLEVLLPLHGKDPNKILGFAQYYVDARPLANELATISHKMNFLTSATLLIGATLIGAVVAVAYHRLRRAQQIIAERNERLMRTNFELTFAAKASALGQITSHLIHGLQGPVASLKAVVDDPDHSGGHAADWEVAANYTDRMQVMIQETVGLLNDSVNRTSYQLSAHELLSLILERNSASAAAKGVKLGIAGGFDHPLDSHRGGLLCLIANNLVQNAIEATPAGNGVTVSFEEEERHAILTVTDQGRGISDKIQDHLFEPGRSGRAGGSGLGLAISRLLAQQIGAVLKLNATGTQGSTFSVTLPLQSSTGGLLHATAPAAD